MLNTNDHRRPGQQTKSDKISATLETGIHGEERPVRFAIVTPTLNAARFLSECLASVNSQRAPGIEVEHLVLDGGSTDGTLELLEQANVTRLPRRPEDTLVEAMDMGYRSAQGDLVGFLGADDILMPGALESVAEIWRREQRPLIICRARWGNAELRSRGELSPAPRWMTAPLHACLGWNYIGIVSTFMTPDLYRELGGLDTTLTHCEDYEFLTRAIARGVPRSRLHDTVSIFRLHGENTSAVQDSEAQRAYRTIVQRYGPDSRALQRLLEVGLKSWIYFRHPQWAHHQVRSKIRIRSLRGRGAG